MAKCYAAIVVGTLFAMFLVWMNDYSPWIGFGGGVVAILLVGYWVMRGPKGKSHNPYMGFIQ